MNEQLLKFLEMVRERLGAFDARAEFGGREPTDPRLVWCEASEHFRIVCAFEAEPLDRSGLTRTLKALVETFLDSTRAPALQRRVVGGARARLDEVLRDLVARQNALAAVVRDRNSVLVWGWSLPGDCAAERSREGLEHLAESNSGAAELAELARSLLQAERVIEDQEEPELLQLADGQRAVWRPFAGIYWVAICFDASRATQLRVEAALLRALPQIERLVVSLPPEDPEPRKRRAVPMLRLV